MYYCSSLHNKFGLVRIYFHYIYLLLFLIVVVFLAARIAIFMSVFGEMFQTECY
jgi:hypothetical protein